MAVTVVINTFGTGTAQSVETFQEAGHFQVRDDGHLYVFNHDGSNRKTYGVFAPGSWVRASADEQAAYSLNG